MFLDLLSCYQGARVQNLHRGLEWAAFSANVQGLCLCVSLGTRPLCQTVSEPWQWPSTFQ